MPVVVDAAPRSLAALLPAMPVGTHAVDSADRMHAWLDQHSEEYVVVLGPTLRLADALAVCERLRTARPTLSVVLVRDELSTDLLTDAMRAGAREVVAAEDLAGVTAAITRADELHVALRGPSGAAHVGTVVTVFSPKGGVGKTTVAVNLALALTARGARKVCLVDLDLAFGDVAITLQLFPTHSVEHAIGSEDTLDPSLLEGLLTRHPESMMVLAAPAHPDVRERVTPALVAKVLRTLRETFDVVVVDTAPSFDEQTLTALDETDECVLVATLDVPTLKNVKVALETLEMLDIARDHRHLVLNRADDAVGISADKVEAILGMEVAAQVSSSLDIAAATNAGSPIILDNPGHQASVALRGLAARLCGEPATAPSAGRTEAPDPEAPTWGARRFKLRRA